jgi:hypothetical protein
MKHSVEFEIFLRDAMRLARLEETRRYVREEMLKDGADPEDAEISLNIIQGIILTQN